MLDEFLMYLYEQVANGSVYLLGAQGQTVASLDNKTIEYREHYDEANIKRVNAKIEQNSKIYNKSKMRAFDCSGLVMYFLQQLSCIAPQDYNCNGIRGVLCDTTEYEYEDIKPGMFLFKLENGRATHIAVAVNSEYCIEARGRDYGVVISNIAERKFDSIRIPFAFKEEIENYGKDYTEYKSTVELMKEVHNRVARLTPHI